MGPRGADDEGREGSSPRVRSLRLQLSVASLLLQALPVTDQVPASTGIFGQATSSGGGVRACQFESGAPWAGAPMRCYAFDVWQCARTVGRIGLLIMSPREGTPRASVRQRQSPPCRITQQFAFADVGDIAALAAELHDLRPLSGSGSPLGARCGILFNTDDTQFAVTELYTSEFLRTKHRNRVRFVPQINFSRPSASDCCHTKISVSPSVMEKSSDQGRDSSDAQFQLLA